MFMNYMDCMKITGMWAGEGQELKSSGREQGLAMLLKIYINKLFPDAATNVTQLL